MYKYVVVRDITLVSTYIHRKQDSDGIVVDVSLHEKV